MVHHEGPPHARLKRAEAPAPLLHIVEKPIIEDAEVIEDREGANEIQNVAENVEVSSDLAEQRRLAEEARQQELRVIRAQLMKLTDTVPMQKRVVRPQPVQRGANTDDGTPLGSRYAA